MKRHKIFGDEYQYVLSETGNIVHDIDCEYAPGDIAESFIELEDAVSEYWRPCKLCIVKTGKWADVSD